MPIHPYRRHRLFTLLDEEEEEDKKKQYRLVLRSAAFIPLLRRQQARSLSLDVLKRRTSTLLAIMLVVIIFFSYSAFAFTVSKLPETLSVSTPAPVPSTSATIPSMTVPPTTVPLTPIPTPTPSPIQRTLTSQQTQSQTVNATGQGTAPGTQAKGVLTLRNPYNGTPIGVDMTLNAGTVFDDDAGNSPNVQMMIDATVTVPGDGTHVTVPAHVVQIGTIGNISQIRGWTHYGTNQDPVPLDIDNSTPFTGGTDPQTYTTVQQSDIDTAANSLEATTQQSAVADIKSQLHSNEHLVGDPQCSFTVTSDYAAGDQANTVTVTVQTTCGATAST